MIPSLGDRLSSMRRALHQVIIPALPSDNGLALEQAHLLMAHLALIEEQADLSDAYEADELRSLVTLAEKLVAGAKGGSKTTSSSAALDDLLGEALAAGVRSRRERIVAIAAAIEALLAASGEDGDGAFIASSHDLVISATQAMTHRDRAWFRSTGFECGDVDLPEPAQTLGLPSS